jgi:hypothetical protein
MEGEIARVQCPAHFDFQRVAMSVILPRGLLFRIDHPAMGNAQA